MSDFYDYITDSDLWAESGKRIRQLRLKKGITSQEKFSDMVGCERRLPGRWETGKAPIIKTADLAMVCRILDCDPDYITCQCDTIRKNNDNIVSVTGLSEDAIEVLRDEKIWKGSFVSPFGMVVSDLIKNKTFFSKLSAVKTVYNRDQFARMASIIASGYDGMLPTEYAVDELLEASQDMYIMGFMGNPQELLLYGAEYDLFMELKKYIEQK